MTDTTDQAVAENLAQVRARMAEACRAAGRPASSVRLVAVTKGQPLSLVQAAVDAGQRDLGENHVQAFVERAAQVTGSVDWHLIGHLQTNKARQAIRAAWLHTVDSVRVARALATAWTPGLAAQRVLVQVDIAGEATKSGVAPGHVATTCTAVGKLGGLDLRGLMCIPPPGQGRRYFAALRELRDQVEREIGAAVPELSMGMSDDYADAIAEGATMVRVGTAIFGARPRP